MPSYRCVLTIGALAPGSVPGDVERVVREAVEADTVLEAFQVDVVRGAAPMRQDVFIPQGAVP